MRRLLAATAAFLLLSGPARADPSGAGVTPGSAGTQSYLAGCIYRSTPAVATSGQQLGQNCDAAGNLVVSVTPSGTQDTNLKQVNGSTVNVGTGAASTGTQRVTTSTDSTIGTVTAVTSITNALPAGTNSIGTVKTTALATTPAAGAASAIVTGGVAVTLVTGPVNGCFIVNPLSTTDQGVTAEVAYVNGVTTATAAGNGTNTNLAAGQSWTCVPGQTTNVSAIAATSGHKFTVQVW